MKNSMEKIPELIILTGPTASGKSQAIYSLPQDLPIEIINADSRQVYYDLKIGTALPQEEELKKFPHHLYAFLGIEEKITVGYFFSQAKKLIVEILARKKIPIICGGTYYYIKTLLDGLYEEPEISEEVKEKVNRLTIEEKWQIIKERDPEFYAKIDKKNPRRVDRAVLLLLSTNQKISSLKKEQGIRHQYHIEILCPNISREKLYENINQRTQRMFSNGLLQEILQLKERNIKPTAFGVTAIGYREILQMAWEKNWHSIEDIPPDTQKALMEMVAQKTRNFAKRQLTWLKKEKMLKKVDPAILALYLSQFIKKRS